MNNVESPSIFEQFFSLSTEMLCVLNSKNQFEVTNLSFNQMLGHKEATLEGISFLDFLHPEDEKNTLEKFEPLRINEKPITFESRLRHQSGRYLTLSWKGSIDLKTGYIFLVARDITEQAQIKTKLQHLQNALEQETIYAETDVRGVITKVNNKFCEISGYSEKELIGKTHKLINSGYHPPSFFKDIWTEISSGRIWSGAIKNKKKNGGFYYVQSILLPIFDQNNKISNYIAIRQDITDKVNSEYERLKALDILSETSSVANVGGWEMDAATGTLRWTDETFRILDVEKVNGLTPMLPEGISFFIEKDRPIIEKAVEQARVHGVPYGLELQAQTPEGNVKWVYTTGKANYQDGKIETISGIIQDIHQRKLAEIKYNKEKQKSVINSKFAALGELSANIAHEINNPLGVISGYAELIQLTHSTIIPEDLMAKSALILKSCDRIAHIVKSLKKFSRSDEESLYVACSLKNLINEAITLTRPKLKSQMIVLRSNAIVEGDIMCNEIEIEQVLVNLINNAIDAIANLTDKWIEITVTEQKKSFRLSVTDSGTGIAVDCQSSIFEPFVTSKAASEGTGLGLSIVKGILDNHNAIIAVDNDNNNTSFVIDFPKIVKEH
ncbi:MAG: PAS domain S-box protein [Thalassotalea sp.]